MIHQLITRRDFLKLKSFALVWCYFLQDFGINMLNSEVKKIDYALLDKLQKLPFSDEVKKEINFRVMLQKNIAPMQEAIFYRLIGL